ncbi:hypothetical protein LIER_12658 [Lithospermum erythrorhizon]|uniref:Uncharacterized protein n=1 Tax=Lithospermum erythrorhizon TaxID=34254 RepID=A0AAV3PU45_LITER
MNLNNSLVGWNEDAPPSAWDPINIGCGRTLPEVGSSYQPEMAGLIQGLTGQIVHIVMEEPRERLPQWRGETMAVSSSIREEDKSMPSPRRGTNTELAGLAPFSSKIRSATMPVGMKLPSFTKFMGRMNPEEHIA